MSSAALGWWVEGLLVEHIGCTRAQAESAAASLGSKRSRRDPVLAAAAFAALALATPRLPGGSSWWHGAGSEARAQVLEGRPDRAERAVARALGQGASMDGAWDEAHRSAEVLFAAAEDPEA